MDDVIALARAWLLADLVLIALWAKYAPKDSQGKAPGVYVRAPVGKDQSVYPTLVLTGASGNGMSTGEGTLDFLTGWLRLTTLTRDTDTIEGDDLMWQIANRATAVLYGDQDEGLPGLQDQEPPGPPDADGNPTAATWAIDVCKVTTPNGPAGDADPLVSRHIATFKVMIRRLD